MLQCTYVDGMGEGNLGWHQKLRDESLGGNEQGVHRRKYKDGNDSFRPL